jgi:hypothetical protein
MPRYRPPHCASSYHFQVCVCRHERQLHALIEDEEKGVCKERGCDCIRFVLAPNYFAMEHRTIR